MTVVLDFNVCLAVDVVLAVDAFLAKARVRGGNVALHRPQQRRAVLHSGECVFVSRFGPCVGHGELVVGGSRQQLDLA